MRRRLPLMLSPISLAAFSTVPVAAPMSPLAASPSAGPVTRPFADPSRQAAPVPALPSAPGAIPPRGSLLDLSV
jgi:hypothetical protein